MSLTRLNADQVYPDPSGTGVIDSTYFIPANADLIVVNLYAQVVGQTNYNIIATINGITLVEENKITGSPSNITAAVFYLINTFSAGPADLRIELVIPPDTPSEMAAIVQSYSNVDITNPFNSTQNNIISEPDTGSVTIPAPNPPLISNQIVVDLFTTNLFPIIFEPTPPDTVVYQNRLLANGGFSGGLLLFQRNLSTNTNIANQSYTYSFFSISDFELAYISYVINGVAPPICVAGTTRVLMADGTEKEIWQIQRGDLVYTNAERTEIRPVAKVIKNYVHPDVDLRMVRIKPNAIGKDMPNRELLITASHPIVWNGERKRAKFFRKINGVKFYKKIAVKNILPLEENGHHYLYDLIFEDNLYYHANGVLVQAHSPEYLIGALSKEDYFNKDKIGHVCDYPHPLVNSLVEKIKVVN